MTCMTFKTACAVILSASALLAAPVMARDIGSPPDGGACDLLSQHFIQENGGIGIRARVDAWMQRDGLYFNIPAEERRKLVASNDAFGGLPAVIAENARIPEPLVRAFGIERGIQHLADMTNRYGGWAVVVPYQDTYAAQVLVQTGQDETANCVFAYVRPEYMQPHDVSARLMN